MPKNTFQRPQAVIHRQNVPRHGSPLPQRKVEVRKLLQPKPDASLPLPALGALLKQDRH
jgi:hypothetical protein